MVLPTNIDSSYADSGTDASVQAHQQHHDTVHGAVNALAGGTTGQVLAKTSSADYALGWSTPSGASAAVTASFALASSTGKWCVPGWRIGSTATLVNQAGQTDVQTWYPIYIAGSMTFDRLSCVVGTAASAGALIRMGIYNDAGTLTPTGATTVLVDGTVAGDTTGQKDLTISVTLSGWKWLAFNMTATAFLKNLPSTMIPPFSARFDAPDYTSNYFGHAAPVTASSPLAANPTPAYKNATNNAACAPLFLRMV